MTEAQQNEIIAIYREEMAKVLPGINEDGWRETTLEQLSAARDRTRARLSPGTLSAWDKWLVDQEKNRQI